MMRMGIGRMRKVGKLSLNRGKFVLSRSRDAYLS